MNRYRKVLYIGVTSELYTRVTEHRQKDYPDSFSAKYNTTVLVFYRSFESIEEAIDFEKKVKKWKRQWKMELILSENPELDDLYPLIDGDF